MGKRAAVLQFSTELPQHGPVYICSPVRKVCRDIHFKFFFNAFFENFAILSVGYLKKYFAFFKVFDLLYDVRKK